ncbi:MAG TPA: hypothetical protein VHR86_00465, partial [Armatimonadota bacterium]|nr:hypothetical protein [Armatimonadota bacterium]
MRAPWKFLKRAAFSIVFLFGYAAFTVITQPGLFRVDVDDPPTAGPTEYRLIANLHDIWLQRDRSRAAEAMQALHYDHELVRVQALWTLACLECRESLPAVEKLEQDPAYRVKTYAQMTAARLKTIPDTPAKDFRELRRQMRAFLREAHLSAFQVAYYVRHPYARNHTAW